MNIRTLAMIGLAASITAPQALRADEAADQDMKVKLQSLEEAVDGLNKRVDTLSGLFIEGFVDTRYDDERTPATPKIVTGVGKISILQQGQSGMFNRRAEIKLNGNVTPTSVFNLGFDFTELKLKDAGMEWREIPMIPFVDLPDYNLTARIGQYRMPFGIIPQTSSSALNFSERPLLNGGKMNLNTAVGAKSGFATNLDTSSPFAYTAAKIVSERIMGVQVRQKVKYAGILNYDLQAGAFNNTVDDQASGKNKIGAADAFAKQQIDQDLSYVGRLGLELDFLQVMLNNMTLAKNKFQVGVSYMKDNQNTVYMATAPDTQAYQEIVGTEFLLELMNKMIILQSEYVHSTVFTTTNTATLPAMSPFGKNQLTEGYYVDFLVDLLPMVTTPQTGDALQVAFRYEGENFYTPDNNAATLAVPIGGGSFVHSINRIGTGIKYSYAGGKNHTSINYYLTAPDNQFGGDQREHNVIAGGTGVTAPDSMIVIQQQFAFENGKAK